MKKKKVVYYLFVFVIYLLLLMVLTETEANAPGSKITNYFEAIWYSLTTLTTVGYGDFYPVTVLGRILGLFFMLLSVGFFGFTISWFVVKLSGVIIPLLLMIINRGAKWYIFTDLNNDALCLADSIAEYEEDSLLIFCNKKNEVAVGYKVSNKAIFVELSSEEVLKMKKNKGKCSIVSMGEKGLANCQKYIENCPTNTEIFCETDMYVDSIPSHTHFINHYICTARSLWTKYPLKRNERIVVFSDCDKYGNEIIEQALLVNVDGELGRREYHIFGSAKDFMIRHPYISECFGINEKKDGKDSLYFYDDNILNNAKLLKKADRIVICGDDENINVATLGKICQYVPVMGNIFIRENTGLRVADSKVVFFGSDKEVLCYDVVIREMLFKKAQQMHEDYCKQNPDKAVEWGNLTNFTRRSNMSVADHIATKVRILLEDEIEYVDDSRLSSAREKYKSCKADMADFFRKIEHERWMRFYILNNWSYGKKRDDKQRKHNMLVSYDSLSIEEQMKDDYGWEIL